MVEWDPKGNSLDDGSCWTCTESIDAHADLVGSFKADERAVMTYVSCYYHAFQGAMQVSVR